MTLRIALKPGAELRFSQETCYTIKGEVGRGGSCIVYDAFYRTNAGDEKTVRIKECYPYDLQMKREPSGTLICPEETAGNFEAAKKRMYAEFRLCNRLFSAESGPGSIINMINIYEGNNTVYTVSAWSGESVLSSHYPDSLKNCISIVRQTAYAIQCIHQAGFLYLDIKPENISVIGGAPGRVQLFDFDSLLPLSGLKDGENLRLSYTKGFAAMELCRGDFSKIGFHTDVYGIGALLFYLLFGRTPEIPDCDSGAVYDFKAMKFSEQASGPALKLLENFFRKTLSVYPLDRWQNMGDVVRELEIINKQENQPEGDYRKMKSEKKLILNTKWCKGCGICTAFCPKSVLAMRDDKAFIQNEENCIFCGQCEMRCPDYAIYIREKIEENEQWAKPY